MSRMAQAEKATGLATKLTAPMILFFLTVLFVVILGPAAIRVMGLRQKRMANKEGLLQASLTRGNSDAYFLEHTSLKALTICSLYECT